MNIHFRPCCSPGQSATSAMFRQSFTPLSLRDPLTSRLKSTSKSSQETADAVTESLPIKLTSQDVDQYPEFIKLLTALKSQISPDGISDVLKKDLEEAQESLKHEKYAWLQFHILYLELQEMIIDFETKSQDIAPSSSSSQYYEVLKESLTTSEIGDYLECNLDPGSDATLLGLTKDSLEKSNPLRKHAKAIQQKLIPDIEDRLKKKCESLVSFHEPAESGDSDRFALAKASQLPTILESEKKSVEEQKKLLKKDRSQKDRQFWAYYQALMDSLQTLEELITKHRLQSQAENDTITSEWLAARCDALCLKIRMVELQILCETYHSETVKALRKIRHELDNCLHDNQVELSRVTQALNAYESVGMGFDGLVHEYAQLKDEIENKKWALSELKASLPEHGK